MCVTCVRCVLQTHSGCSAHREYIQSEFLRNANNTAENATTSKWNTTRTSTRTRTPHTHTLSAQHTTLLHSQTHTHSRTSNSRTRTLMQHTTSHTHTHTHMHTRSHFAFRQNHRKEQKRNFGQTTKTQAVERCVHSPILSSVHSLSSLALPLSPRSPLILPFCCCCCTVFCALDENAKLRDEVIPDIVKKMEPMMKQQVRITVFFSHPVFLIKWFCLRNSNNKNNNNSKW